MDGSVRDATREVDGFSSAIFVYGLSHRSIETTTARSRQPHPWPLLTVAFDAATSSHRWNDSTRGDVVGWRRRVVSVVCLIDARRRTRRTRGSRRRRRTTSSARRRARSTPRVVSETAPGGGERGRETVRRDASSSASSTRGSIAARAVCVVQRASAPSSSSSSSSSRRDEDLLDMAQNPKNARGDGSSSARSRRRGRRRRTWRVRVSKKASIVETSTRREVMTRGEGKQKGDEAAPRASTVARGVARASWRRRS